MVPVALRIFSVTPVSPLNLAHFSPVALRAHHSQAPFRIIFENYTSYCETLGVLARPVVAETETGSFINVDGWTSHPERSIPVTHFKRRQRHQKHAAIAAIALLQALA